MVEFSLDWIRSRSAETDDGCWEWQGARSNVGYGTITIAVHRLAAFLAHGIHDESGRVVRHTCDNRRCVNPSHLVYGTFADNAHDTWARGRAWSPFYAMGEERAGRTHCPAGHPYDEANTYRSGPDGRYRRCRACNTEHARKQRIRKALLKDAR